jgi:ribonuclease R
MVGNRSGTTYRLGDRVTVKLVEAAPVAGALRFELLSEGRPGKPSRRPRHEQHQNQYRPRGKQRKAR